MSDTIESGSDRLHGSCLCGAVKVEALSEPKWTGHCHCPSCRKAVSAGMATYAGFEEADVSLKGDSLKVYKSSPGVERAFCGNCGSPVYFKGEKWPTELHLHLMMLDNAADYKPLGHVYVSTQMPWMTIQDDLPKKEKF